MLFNPTFKLIILELLSQCALVAYILYLSLDLETRFSAMSILKILLQERDPNPLFSLRCPTSN